MHMCMFALALLVTAEPVLLSAKQLDANGDSAIALDDLTQLLQTYSGETIMSSLRALADQADGAQAEAIAKLSALFGEIVAKTEAAEPNGASPADDAGSGFSTAALGWAVIAAGAAYAAAATCVACTFPSPGATLPVRD